MPPSVANPQLPLGDVLVNKHLNHIHEMLNTAAQVKISYAEEKLNAFEKNLEIDPILMLAYIGIDLTKLTDMRVERKRRFMQDISALVDKYANLPKTDEDMLI